MKGDFITIIIPHKCFIPPCWGKKVIGQTGATLHLRHNHGIYIPRKKSS